MGSADPRDVPTLPAPPQSDEDVCLGDDDATPRWVCPKHGNQWSEACLACVREVEGQ